MHQRIHVGIVGAGLGGLAAAIALRRVDAEVTVLEAASELGEIGAGIQMTPNVSRLLLAWGVTDVIGKKIVQIRELNLRRQDGTKMGHISMEDIESQLGYPWYVVHRAHLHESLLKIAESNGAKILIDSRASEIQYTTTQASITTTKGKRYVFDLLVGSDGLHSTVRRILLPTVAPMPPTTNCCYRATVPYSQIKKDPVARELIQKSTMEVWMGNNSYIISYPISGGEVFNMVLAHHRPKPVTTVENVDMDELRDTYKDYDPRIKRIINMVPEAQRWPLMVTGPLDTWSSSTKNVVLIGDAAHSMVNHMAQGAATSMEDGAFLALVVGEVVKGNISIAEAVNVYEEQRMPKAYAKQQISFLNGAIWQLPDGPAQQARDQAMARELQGQQSIRSSNLYGDPTTVLEVYGYDVESHAKHAISIYLQQQEPADRRTGVTKALEDKYMNWFLIAKRKDRERL